MFIVSLPLFNRLSLLLDLQFSLRLVFLLFFGLHCKQLKRNPRFIYVGGFEPDFFI